MFEALVLICLYGDINQQCIEAADDRGPYVTVEECSRRVAEMVYDLSRVQSPFKPAGTQCKEIGQAGEPT